MSDSARRVIFGCGRVLGSTDLYKLDKHKKIEMKFAESGFQEKSGTLAFQNRPIPIVDQEEDKMAACRDFCLYFHETISLIFSYNLYSELL